MTNQTPRISVIIPSFNKVRFISKTLSSIFEQNYTNLEVIVQDGGSTDGTLEIIEKFAHKHPEVLKYESKIDKGQLDAINKGLRKATGDILTYINADDVYKPGALNSVAEAYIKNPEASWFVGRGSVIDKNGKEIAKLVTLYKSLCLRLNFYFLLLIFNFVMQPSVFFTKKAYKQSLASQGPGKKYGLFTGTGNFVMEYDLWLALGAVSMPVVIDKSLSCFRISGENISSTSFKDTLGEDFKTVRKYTANPLILLLHILNNLGRVLVICVLKK
jgi:glycosyltransferase involved in cell wall biosynthesis